MGYYKVVSLNKAGTLVSNVSIGKARVHYNIGEWVSAPQWLASQGYQLFVFNYLRGAAAFHCFGYGLVYKCLVRGVAPELPKFLQTHGLAIGRFKACKEAKESLFPPGTTMVKQVKLTELVR